MCPHSLLAAALTRLCARPQATHLSSFDQVQSIQTLLAACDGSAAVQLRVAGRPEPLALTCNCLRQADNLADLVDGYCRLVNNSPSSLWTRKGRRRRVLGRGGCACQMVLAGWLLVMVMVRLYLSDAGRCSTLIMRGLLQVGCVGLSIACYFGSLWLSDPVSLTLSCC